MTDFLSYQFFVGIILGGLIVLVIYPLFKKKNQTDLFKDNLDEMGKNIKSLQEDNLKYQGYMSEKLKFFTNSGENFEKIANEMKNTLVAGSSQKQGACGEMVLEHILTKLQFTEGEEFEKHGEPTLLNDFLANFVEQVAPLANDRAIDLLSEFNGELWTKVPKQVLQILVINLLRNAINYTDKGAVTISVSATKFTVKDTGIGMSADELHQAFEPFYRGERARVANAGHGLGLSIVRRMVEQFSGRIDVQSEAGVGTKISVSFPLPVKSAST